MKQEINITLVLMRMLGLLICLCFVASNAIGNNTQSYQGWLLIKGKKTSFSIRFSVAQNNLISGTSLTAKGTKEETKCRIKGKYNPKNKSILFYETVVLSSKAKYKNLNFCLLMGNLTRKETKQLIKYSGKLTGYVRGTKTICANGKVFLETTRPKKKNLPTPKKIVTSIKTDTLLSHIAGKKIISYKWKSSSSTLEIWDNVQADGDRVDIYLDGKKIVANYELKENKKMIPLALSGGEHIIKIVALNEGKASPNTSQINLKSDSNAKKLIAHIRAGEQVYIKLTQ